MTLKECYDAIGGNYENVIGRLRKESMVQKFVLMFLKDDNLSAFEKAWQEKNIVSARRAVHTIKGNSLNLDFDKLAASSDRLCELLKPYVPKDDAPAPPALTPEVIKAAEELFEEVKADYTKTRAAIQAFKDSLEG